MLITFDNDEDAAKVKEQIAADMPPGTVNLSAGSRGFAGTLQSDLLILASSLTPILIRKMADLLSKLATAGTQRQVSINGISLKGYAAADVLKILEEAAKLEQPKPKRKSQ